jgi:histone H1/5
VPKVLTKTKSGRVTKTKQTAPPTNKKATAPKKAAAKKATPKKSATPKKAEAAA